MVHDFETATEWPNTHTKMQDTGKLLKIRADSGHNQKETSN